MGLDTLLSRLERQAVTPVPSATSAGVTPKPAPILVCTSVTPVTSLADVTAVAPAEPFPDVSAAVAEPFAAREAAAVRAWLGAVGETDAEAVGAVLRQCPDDASRRTCVVLRHRTRRRLPPSRAGAAGLPGVPTLAAAGTAGRTGGKRVSRNARSRFRLWPRSSTSARMNSSRCPARPMLASAAKSCARMRSRMDCRLAHVAVRATHVRLPRRRGCAAAHPQRGQSNRDGSARMQRGRRAGRHRQCSREGRAQAEGGR